MEHPITQHSHCLMCIAMCGDEPKFFGAMCKALPMLGRALLTNREWGKQARLNYMRVTLFPFERGAVCMLNNCTHNEDDLPSTIYLHMDKIDTVMWSRVDGSGRPFDKPSLIHYTTGGGLLRVSWGTAPIESRKNDLPSSIYGKRHWYFHRNGRMHRDGLGLAAAYNNGHVVISDHCCEVFFVMEMEEAPERWTRYCNAHQPQCAQRHRTFYDFYRTLITDIDRTQKYVERFLRDEFPALDAEAKAKAQHVLDWARNRKNQNNASAFIKNF